MSATTASTLTSIAAEAGVSVSTVSKVLNGRTDVAPATRERIGLLLRRHGYQPGAKLGFGVVDLLLGWQGFPAGDRRAQSLGGGADPRCRGRPPPRPAIASWSTPVNSASEFDRWLELATVRGTYGALSVLHLPRGAELQHLAAAGIPVVVIDPADGTGPGYQVGRHHQLARRPYRHPSSHRAGPSPHRRHRRAWPGLWSSQARVDGYRAAMLEAGLAVDERLICRDRFTVDGGQRQAATPAEPDGPADRDRDRQ